MQSHNTSLGGFAIGYTASAQEAGKSGCVGENRFLLTKHLFNRFCLMLPLRLDGYGRRICKHLFYKAPFYGGAGQINYHLKQNEPAKNDSHIIQLFNCAYIFRGQRSVLQCIVAGATMTCDKLLLALHFVSVHATRLRLNEFVKAHENRMSGSHSADPTNSKGLPRGSPKLKEKSYAK